MRVPTLAIILAPVLLLAACQSSPSASDAATPPASSGVLTPSGTTDAVAHDPDDPAIWVHASDASKSLILATDKTEAEGALYVFGIDGRTRQVIAPLDRPNNVDVEYGVTLGGATVDIAVLTERKKHRLRVFSISADGTLTDIAPDGLPVLEGQAGEASEPMGISLYKRASDGALFAIVAPKTGEKTDYLWEYRIEDGPEAAPRATFVRRFGAFSRVGAEPGDIGEIEAVVVDDELGFVYYSDERAGIRKYWADPDRPDASQELALFATGGYEGDREGLAIYRHADGTGFIISSDQVDGGTRVHLFPREGMPGHPHEHPELAVVSTAADATDGLDVTSRPLPGLPAGMLVMMNSGPKNFLIYGWEDVGRMTGVSNSEGRIQNSEAAGALVSLAKAGFAGGRPPSAGVRRLPAGAWRVAAFPGGRSSPTTH